MPSITDPLLDALGFDALVAALLCVVLTALIVTVPAATGPLFIAAAILTEYSAHLAAAVLLLVAALRLLKAAAISPLLRWAVRWLLWRVGLVGTRPRTAWQAVADSLPARALTASVRAYRRADANVDSADLVARPAGADRL